MVLPMNTPLAYSVCEIARVPRVAASDDGNEGHLSSFILSNELSMTIGELNRLLKDLTEGRLTRLLLLEHDIVEHAGEYLTELLPSGRCLVVADATTWPLAGDRLAASLGRCGYETDRHLVPLRDGYSSPLAGDAEVEALDERLLLAALPFSSVTAVGGGTINDIAKLAAFRRGLPYAVIPTTPSMNGYTSGIAAILQAGVKTTISSRVPVACLADLTLLQAAPARMIAAGLGDMVSRPVSLADWYLSHRLLGTEYSAAAVTLAETGRRPRGRDRPPARGTRPRCSRPSHRRAADFGPGHGRGYDVRPRQRRRTHDQPLSRYDQPPRRRGGRLPRMPGRCSHTRHG